MHLLLMRHAKSSWDDPALSDHDRPLNKRGRAAAPVMGAALVKRKLIPTRIISSSALRAVETAHLLLPYFPKAELHIQAQLYEFQREDWLRWINQSPEDQLILAIGHNPGLEEAVSELNDQVEHMPTAAVAVLKRSEDTWKLREILRPRDLM